ncbi:hypothetical protein HRbin26_01577 [bacterium HR26]|nr:hypothetical protein HRbin26_01577 [bacterium HR26]
MLRLERFHERLVLRAVEERRVGQTAHQIQGSVAHLREQRLIEVLPGRNQRDLVLEPELLVLHDEPDRVGTRAVEGIDGIDLANELAEPLQVGAKVLRPKGSIHFIDDLPASLLECASERGDVLVPRSVVGCRDGHSLVSEGVVCVRCHRGILLAVGNGDAEDVRAPHGRIARQGLQASVGDNRGQLVLHEIVFQRSSLVTQGNASQQVHAVALDELPRLRERLLGLAGGVFDEGLNRSPGDRHPRLLESKLQPAEVTLAVGSRWARQVEKNTQPDRLSGDRRRCGGWGSCGGRGTRRTGRRGRCRRSRSRRACGRSRRDCSRSLLPTAGAQQHARCEPPAEDAKDRASTEPSFEHLHRLLTCSYHPCHNSSPCSP